ncbi:sensor histidine kinase [Amycolatopsis magusensis]|uniref:sensor histidine kinase n=1 Tax=Amycolatopsis magusensis TaxID=882444 RepID=UPI003C2E701B
MNPFWTTRRTRLFLVVVNLPIAVAPPVFTLVGTPQTPPTPYPALIPVALGLLLAGLQLRHSMAAARGERPEGWQWTLGAMAVLAYLPLVWFGRPWLDAQVLLAASALMVVPRRCAVPVAAVPLVVTAISSAWQSEPLDDVVQFVFVVLSGVLLSIIAVALYGAARLVRLVEELQVARMELGELAAERERLRLSRDLHDLLGQSLFAVSLKGDLAIRLLRHEPGKAKAEIESLVVVAQEALRGVREVTRDEHVASLPKETEGAVALLEAAGIGVRLDLDLPAPHELPDRVHATLAWALREGVTNILRHSQATGCEITGGTRDGKYALEIVNDGADGEIGEGSGLAGLSDRVVALSGSAVVEHTGDGRFRLSVEIPQEAT